ncbi:amidohydrolase [Streptomyces sp. NPDC101490]|uniref:amidohydrolase n=1 Tax=Streptomyces sp. NPDC101490 TaxID=3366143 RepID=UPI00380D5A6B
MSTDPVTTLAAVPDTVFVNATVITVDPARPRAEALAVTAGRITAVGTEAEVRALAGPLTETVDLAGRTVLPGFVEAHGHPTVAMTIDGPDVVDIRPMTCPTAESVVATIRETVAAAEPGEPLAFFGWDILLQEGLEEPTKAWLDELAPGNPLAILQNSAHLSWGNSLAIKAIELTRDTVDPDGCHFERDERGEPTGKAVEVPASLMMMGTPFNTSPERAPELLAHEHDVLASRGLTMTGDLGLRAAMRPVCAELAVTDRAKVRVRAYEMSDAAMRSGAAPGDGDSAGGAMFRQIGIKMWADGSPWIGNIATSFPYLNTPQTAALGLALDHRGCANYTADQVRDIIDAYFSEGWQLACHVHGDTAVEMLLDVFAEKLPEYDRPDHRTRFEHCGTMTADQYRRAARLGITCSLFVDHIYYWGDVLVDSLFGERAHDWANARAALDAGMRISFHNDAPVTPVEPLRNIQVAVTRRTRSGARVLGPEHRVDLDEAIRAQTADAAWQLQSEHEAGSIEIGKYADLVVLSADPYETDPHEIGDIEVLATYLAGAPTFTAAATPVTTT